MPEQSQMFFKMAGMSEIISTIIKKLPEAKKKDNMIHNRD